MTQQCTVQGNPNRTLMYAADRGTSGWISAKRPLLQPPWTLCENGWLHFRQRNDEIRVSASATSKPWGSRSLNKGSECMCKPGPLLCLAVVLGVAYVYSSVCVVFWAWYAVVQLRVPSVREPPIVPRDQPRHCEARRRVQPRHHPLLIPGYHGEERALWRAITVTVTMSQLLSQYHSYCQSITVAVTIS